MRILVITQYFYPEQFRINDIVKELIDMGHSVTVLTEYPNYPEGNIYEGYGFDIPYDNNLFGANIIRLKAKPRGQGSLNLALNYLSYWKLANRWVKQNGADFDLVFCSQLSPVFSCLPAVIAKKKFGVPVITHVLDLWPESFMCVMHTKNKVIYKMLAHFANKVYKNSDKLLCTSNSFIGNLSSRGIDKNKLIFWPQFAEKIEDKEYDCPSEYTTNYRFTFTGNIGEAQGLDILLDVAEKLKDNSDIGIYLVGDGSHKEALENKANEMNLKNIYFVGRKPITEMPNYLKNATASLLVLEENELSKTTVPAKLQMYMKCGSPVICAIDGEASDVVNRAQCGFTSHYDAKALCDNIINLVELSDEQREVLSNNAKEYADNYYDYDKLMLQLKGYIDEFR